MTRSCTHVPMIATVLYARFHLIKRCSLSLLKTSVIFGIDVFLDLSDASGAMCYWSFRFEPKMSFCPVRNLWRFIFTARDVGVCGPILSQCMLPASSIAYIYWLPTCTRRREVALGN